MKMLVRVSLLVLGGLALFLAILFYSYLNPRVLLTQDEYVERCMSYEGNTRYWCEGPPRSDIRPARTAAQQQLNEDFRGFFRGGRVMFDDYMDTCVNWHRSMNLPHNDGYMHWKRESLEALCRQKTELRAWKR